ncbi:MAG: bifunctional methionine sulfoxide reductase B/A protein [Saprospiraceae bacterium]
MFTFLGLYIYGCAQSPEKVEIKMMTDSMKTEKVTLAEAEWKSKLTPSQYYILREKGTEKPFSGEFVFSKDKGVYKCAGCGESLFTDEMKFESHCGWPSFDSEISGGKIVQTEDNSHGMRRIEITCASCGGHLGHIFDDGPTQTGLRYCVNSLALSFEPKSSVIPSESIESITLGGGCFWCIEAIFEDLKGVKSAVSGYSGGKVKNPSYKEVCSGLTGHAEVVRVTFDTNVLPLTDLLEVFFSLHDPTTLNRQGADVGTQYRSAIFYENDTQKVEAEKVISTLNANGAFTNPIVTEVTEYKNFYSAEDYHQGYYELNKEEPYCRAVIKPKMDKLHKTFAEKLK